MKNKKIYFIIVSSLIIMDQLIKQIVFSKLYKSSVTIIRNVLNMTYVENTGGAYGIGNNNIAIFIISNLIIIGIIITLMIIKKDKLKSTEFLACSLIVSGGISNLIDRIFRGFVIDYIDINQLIDYPMFNLADICIVIGVMLMFISTCKELGEKNENIQNRK